MLFIWFRLAVKIHIIKKKLHGRLEIRILSSRATNLSYSVSAATSWDKFLAREDQIRISKRPCNILYIHVIDLYTLLKYVIYALRHYLLIHVIDLYALSRLIHLDVRMELCYIFLCFFLFWTSQFADKCPDENSQYSRYCYSITELT